MAQAFVTTYKNDYRGITRPRVKPYKLEDIWKSLHDTDRNIWILPEEECGMENLGKLYAEVKERTWKRTRTIYQISYCNRPDQLTSPDQDEALESQITQHCKKLYEDKANYKLLPPLPTARKQRQELIRRLENAIIGSPGLGPYITAVKF